MRTKKQVQSLKVEQKGYRDLRGKLGILKQKLLKDQLPKAMSMNKKECFEYHIMEIQQLLIACEDEIESMVDDLEQE